MKKIKAYSYLRISTEVQKAGDGVRRQLEAGQKYAQEKGYELAETISDLGVSGYQGKNAKEGAFAEFLAAIDDGRVAAGSVLIVESLDRLSRDGATKAFTQFAGILGKGITIVTLMDGQVYTEDSVDSNPGQLFMSLGIMMRANDESATKSKRLKATWEKKRSEIGRKKLTRMMPAWLELNEDRTNFIVRKEAAGIVRRIFDLCIDGMGIYSITRYLNGDLNRYPPISKARNWNSSYVTKILKNPAVHGYFQPKIRVAGKSVAANDPIVDYFPTIVEEERFLLAQSCLNDRLIRGAGRKGANFANLFSNLIKCGNCGGSVLMRSKGKPPKGNKYLRCSNSVMNSGCNRPAWRYSEFEDAFYKFVQEVDFEDVLNEDGAKSRATKLENEKAVLSVKLAEQRKQYEAIIDRLASASLSSQVVASLGQRADTIAQAIKDLEIEFDQTSAKIAELAVVNVGHDQSDFLAKYKILSDERPAEELKIIRFQMHNLIKRSIDQIAVFNGEFVHPWEAIDNISEKLGQRLFESGMTAVDEFENYLSTARGQRAYEQSTRYFKVRFKNGMERKVTPFEDHSIITISEKFAKLREEATANK